MPEALPGGYGVLVTRPRAQAAELADAVRARGGEPILFPTIEISPRDAASVAAEAAALPAPDITIFVSRNAAQHGLEYAGGRLAAIGPGTAAALREQGAEVAIVPTAGFDSESLLAEPAFADVDGLHVRIIRGTGGREVLATGLAGRGARVHYLEAYTRARPTHSPAELGALARCWKAGRIGAIVILSSESAANLDSLLPGECRPGAGGPLLVTPAARVLKEVRTRFPDCTAVLAAGPRANDLVDCIAENIASFAQPSKPPPRLPD